MLKQLTNSANQVNTDYIVEAIAIEPDVWKIRMFNGASHLVDDAFMNGIAEAP